MMSTLADAQIERDKIKAAKAKQEYEKLLSEVVKSNDADWFTELQKRVCAEHLRTLTKLMTDAIGDETDETRIHYLLSDCAIDWLRDLGQAGKAFRVGMERLIDNLAPVLVNVHDTDARMAAIGGAVASEFGVAA